MGVPCEPFTYPNENRGETNFDNRELLYRKHYKPIYLHGLHCYWCFPLTAVGGKMKLFTLGLVVMLSVAGLLPALAQQTCPSAPPLSGYNLNDDTKASVSALRKLLGGAEINNKISVEMRNVFLEHPETIQYYVILVMYHDGCVLIMDNKEFTTQQKLNELATLRDQILPRFLLPPAATTAKPRARHTIGFARMNPIILAAEVDPVGEPSDEPSWAQLYLRPAPFTFTIGNQYWVDVGYATSLADGERKLAELKERNPDYDFALYAPFGRNDKWNIVMASWVSQQEAEKVLSVAKKINPTSFIWRACSQSKGNECILNRKLRLAMHLRRDQ